MTEIFDEYCWTKERQILTQKQHRVSGLKSVSHLCISASEPPIGIHYHSHLLEIHCMVKGIRFVQVRAGDETIEYRAKGNQCLITYPMELHGTGEELQMPCEFYAFQIDLSSPDDLLGLNREYSNELYRLLMSLPSRRMELGAAQFKVIIRIFNLFAEQMPLSTMRASQYLAGFLLGLGELTPIHENEERQIDVPIGRALDYIGAHITENIRLEILAKEAGYSLSRFKTKFKETMGITPAEYVTMQKIELARKRLAEGNESITELAYSLGYSSSNYFCSVFKKLMNCSPQSYRLSCRSQQPVGSSIE